MIENYFRIGFNFIYSTESIKQIETLEIGIFYSKQNVSFLFVCVCSKFTNILYFLMLHSLSLKNKNKKKREERKSMSMKMKTFAELVYT